MSKKIELIECPRDAMQGWKHFIPTETKIEYLNQLLKCGFDVLDFGSFVSAKAIPQLADTKEVLSKLDLSNTATKLLAIIANMRGAEEGVVYDEIQYLGFPFSISETFQQRNTNKTIEQSLAQVAEIQTLCAKNNKELVIYISMGFGNPYGDPYNAEIAINWVKKLSQFGIQIFAMSDTVGVATPDTIKYVFENLLREFKDLKIGAHFHSTSTTWKEKLQVAYDAGCTRYDSAIKGIGGCPMAKDDLVGNIATENVVSWCRKQNLSLGIIDEELDKALMMAGKVFL